MRRALDPESIKIDTSDLAKLNMVDSSGANTFINTKYSTGKKVEVRVESTTQGLLISPTGTIRLGSATSLSGSNSNQHYFELGENGFIRYKYGTVNNYYLPYKENEVGKTYSYQILTNNNVKTLFGNKSISGTGNIDLYKHNLKGVSGDNQVYIHITSSKNTPINSITDLNTYLSSDDYYPATGVYKDGTTFYPIVFMTKSSNVWSVTYNKGTGLGTALISAVAGTITDTVTTV